MTHRRGINSKHTSRDFLKRGLKSMFPNYEKEEKETPLVNMEKTGEKQPSST